jgi:cation diffusion facilitator CzcD-associated flavoprotein CzcO
VSRSDLPALVVGAGPAGLATSRELGRRGVEHRVLERGEQVGASWARLYDSLRLHTGKHLSALPGMPFPAATPLFPPRDRFLDYLASYARGFELPVELAAEALAAERANGGWRVRTPRGDWTARVLVVATGIMSNPWVPDLPGLAGYRGEMLHSIDYRRPEPFLGRRVLVVGTGNSAGEIGAELAAAGVEVALAVRSGAPVVPRELLGIPIQYWALPLAKLPPGARRAVVRGIGKLGELARGPAPLPPGEPSLCPDVPLIGFGLADAIRAGRVALRPAVAGFGAETVRFADGGEESFDVVLLGTGYRAALGLLGDLVRRDRCGFAERSDRVKSRDQPGLYFVGQNYDTRGGLYNIRLDARAVAKRVARELRTQQS